ncbi:MAG: hypothetical protein JWS12_393 [Candidatus Saccharibacteria bacterium]|nr:hypothetical protein [Candidatus Saccharibacteria bacterium]
MTAHPKHVLIVGAGFAGVKTALDLCDDERFKVTLVSDRPTFRYYPTLYHTATGGSDRQSHIPLTTIFKDHHVEVVIASAKKIDRNKKILTTADGQKISYDVIVLALGVVTNYFGIKGLKEYSFGIKSTEDATELKHHLHEQLISQHQPDLNYIVVGGGPTGIELSSSLRPYLKRIMANHGIRHRAIHVDLIEAAPRLLPLMPKKMSRVVSRRLRRLGVKLYLGQAVQGETADSLMVSGKPITSHTVVWTAGVTNHPFFSANGFDITAKGKVLTDQYLQASQDVFVLGDNAYTKYSGLAQTAVTDAKYLAKQLKRQADGKVMRDYKPKRPIYVIPVGPNFAAVLWGKVELYGWLGWVLREVADFVAFHDIEKLLPASKQWLSEFDEQDDCPECAKAGAS